MIDEITGDDIRVSHLMGVPTFVEVLNGNGMCPKRMAKDVDENP